MARLPDFEGGPFTWAARWITDGAHVTGNCFPSSHVAGTWGVVFGLAPYHRRAGFFIGLLAVGVSISCVYTRYHHAVDVPAGFLMGLVGASLFRWLKRGQT
jgi:membrane-associated phospholipid phosphatase